MITLIYAKDEALLDGFKFGADWRTPKAAYTQGVDHLGYWLLISDRLPGDNQTYWLDQTNGMDHTGTGVEV